MVFEELADRTMRQAARERRRELIDDAGQSFEWWYDYRHSRILAFIRRSGDLIADECGGALGARKFATGALKLYYVNDPCDSGSHPDTIYPVPQDNKDGYNPPVSFFVSYLTLA